MLVVIQALLGFKDHPEYIKVPQVAADENDEEDRPLPGSPPSIVYGSRRGAHKTQDKPVTRDTTGEDYQNGVYHCHTQCSSNSSCQ